MQDLFIGLMAGTSLDAVDAALVSFDEAVPTLIGAYSKPLPAALRAELLQLCTPGVDEINRLGALDTQVGQLFASTANALIEQTGIERARIRAIGSHGQNIRHQPRAPWPFTLQIGDPNIIASTTGITTIADFRRRDVALGGQGAPLAPGFHRYAFQTSAENRIILNLGGIANVTFLPADASQQVLGFDTGPANMLLDGWIKQHLAVDFDMHGAWAQSGTVNQPLLDTLLDDPYFQQPAPKSTGREYFNQAWLTQHLLPYQNALAANDVQATLCELTALSIARAINDLSEQPGRILVCGGGVKNTHLMQRLRLLNQPHPVGTTDEVGVPAQWLEAMAWAWLAYQTLQQAPGNLPSVTGASRASILGGIYLA